MGPKARKVKVREIKREKAKLSVGKMVRG